MDLALPGLSFGWWNLQCWHAWSSTAACKLLAAISGIELSDLSDQGEYIKKKKKIPVIRETSIILDCSSSSYSVQRK